MSDVLAPLFRGSPKGASDVLTLTVDGRELSGWQRVSVTRALDTVPASFDIQVTERFPTTLQVDIPPGKPCTVKIGSDLVITGYVDRYGITLSPADHTIRVMGRSMSQDLVDCSALFDTQSGQAGMQKLNGTVLSIAQGLAKPYGVTITTTAPDAAATQIQQFNINLSETPWEIIDRITRFAKLIAYDLPDGSVVLAQSGSDKMATGFVIGANVEAAEVTFSMDERFQEYEGHFLSTLIYGSDAGVNSPQVGQVFKDEDVPRFRKRYIISEQTSLGQSLAGQRAEWEMQRRRGRSRAFTCVCDSWRDGAGMLWSPNHLAPIRAPQLKLTSEDWLIASVTYTRDETGQHAHLVLMPAEAFAPEPIGIDQLQPFLNAVERNNPTKPNPDQSPIVVGPGTA